MAVLVIVVLALGVGAFLDLGKMAHQAWSWPARALMIVLAITVIALRTRSTHILPVTKRDPVSAREWAARIERVPEEKAEELQNQAAALDMRYWQARIFALGIAAPEVFRQRVVEAYEPDRRILSQQVLVECQIPRDYLPAHEIDGTKTPTMLPILVAPKGELQHAFELTDADGQSLRDYSHREYLIIVARVLRELLMSAYGVDAKDAGNFAAEHPKAVSAERYALIEIMGRIGHVLSDGQTASRADALMALEDATNQEQLALAAAITRRLATHYAIVAELPFSPQSRFAVKYRRGLVPKLRDLRDSGTLLERVKGTLQSYLGARPVRVEIELNNAWTTHSYHLEVQAPSSMYLAQQTLNRSPHYLDEGAEGAPTKPYPRFQRRLGQSSAHFYARFFPAPKEREINGERVRDFVPWVEFKFYEVPPGSDFQAAVAATSSFLLVLLVGFVVSRSANDLQSDAPAFLLAFPGVAASWLGFETPEHHLLEGSLSAKLSLMFTTLTSIIASGLFILNRTQSKTWLFEAKLLKHTSFMGIQDILWAVLALAALLNTVWISHRWIVRSWRYSYFARRNSLDLPGNITT